MTDVNRIALDKRLYCVDINPESKGFKKILSIEVPVKLRFRKDERIVAVPIEEPEVKCDETGAWDDMKPLFMRPVVLYRQPVVDPLERRICPIYSEDELSGLLKGINDEEKKWRARWILDKVLIPRHEGFSGFGGHALNILDPRTALSDVCATNTFLYMIRMYVVLGKKRMSRMYDLIRRMWPLGGQPDINDLPRWCVSIYPESVPCICPITHEVFAILSEKKTLRSHDSSMQTLADNLDYRRTRYNPLPITIVKFLVSQSGDDFSKLEKQIVRPIRESGIYPYIWLLSVLCDLKRGLDIDSLYDEGTIHKEIESRYGDYNSLVEFHSRLKFNMEASKAARAKFGSFELTSICEFDHKKEIAILKRTFYSLGPLDEELALCASFCLIRDQMIRERKEFPLEFPLKLEWPFIIVMKKDIKHPIKFLYQMLFSVSERRVIKYAFKYINAYSGALTSLMRLAPNLVKKLESSASLLYLAT